MYVWGVNSTVTKHSDYFVWRDTSNLKRVTRRCDDTVDKKNQFLCTKIPDPLEGVEWPKNRQNPPEMLSPTRY